MSGEKSKPIKEVYFSKSKGNEINVIELSRGTNPPEKGTPNPEKPPSSNKRKSEIKPTSQGSHNSPSKRARAETGIPPRISGNPPGPTGSVNLPPPSKENEEVKDLRERLREAQSNLITTSIDDPNFRENLSRIRQGATALEQSLGSNLESRLQLLITASRYSPDLDTELQNINLEIPTVAVSTTLRDSILRLSTKARHKIDALKREQDAYQEGEVKANVESVLSFLNTPVLNNADYEIKLQAIDHLLNELNSSYPTKFLHEKRKLQAHRQTILDYQPPDQVDIPPNLNEFRQKVSRAIHSKNEPELHTLKNLIAKFHHQPEFQEDWKRITKALERPQPVRTNIREEIRKLNDMVRDNKNYDQAIMSLNSLYNEVEDNPTESRLIDSEIEKIRNEKTKYIEEQQAEKDLSEFTKHIGSLTRNSYHTDSEYHDKLREALDQTAYLPTPTTSLKSRLKGVQGELRKQLGQLDKRMKERPNPALLQSKIRNIQEGNLPAEDKLLKLNELETEVVPHIDEPIYYEVSRVIDAQKNDLRNQIQNLNFPFSDTYNKELNELRFMITRGETTPQHLKRLQGMISDLGPYRYREDKRAKEVLERAEEMYNVLEKEHPSPNQLKSQIKKLMKEHISNKISTPLYLNELDELQQKSSGNREILKLVEEARNKSQEPKQEVNEEFLTQVPRLRQLLTNPTINDLHTINAILRRYPDVDKKYIQPFRDGLLELQKQIDSDFQENADIQFLNDQYFLILKDSQLQRGGEYAFSKENLVDRTDNLYDEVVKRSKNFPALLPLASQLNDLKSKIAIFPEGKSGNRILYQDTIDGYLDTDVEIPNEVLNLITTGDIGKEIVPYKPYNDAEMPSADMPTFQDVGPEDPKFPIEFDPDAVDVEVPLPSHPTRLALGPPPSPPLPPIIDSSIPAIEYQQRPADIIPLEMPGKFKPPIPMPNIPQIPKPPTPPPFQININMKEPESEHDAESTYEPDNESSAPPSSTEYEPDSSVSGRSRSTIRPNAKYNPGRQYYIGDRPEYDGNKYRLRPKKITLDDLSLEQVAQLPEEKVQQFIETLPEIPQIPIPDVENKSAVDEFNLPVEPQLEEDTISELEIRGDEPQSTIGESEEERLLASEDDATTIVGVDEERQALVEDFSKIVPETLQEEVKGQLNKILSYVELHLDEEVKPEVEQLTKVVGKEGMNIVEDIIKHTMVNTWEDPDRTEEEIDKDPKVGLLTPVHNQSIYRPIYQFVEKNYDDRHVETILKAIRHVLEQIDNPKASASNLAILNEFSLLGGISKLLAPSDIHDLTARVKGIENLPNDTIMSVINDITYNKVLAYITEKEKLLTYQLPSIPQETDIPVSHPPNIDSAMDELANMFAESPITTQSENRSRAATPRVATPFYPEPEPEPPKTSEKNEIYEDQDSQAYLDSRSAISSYDGQLIPFRAYVKGHLKEGTVWIPPFAKLPDENLAEYVLNKFIKSNAPPSYNLGTIQFLDKDALDPRELKKLGDLYSEMFYQRDTLGSKNKKVKYLELYKKHLGKTPINRNLTNQLRLNMIPKLDLLVKSILIPPKRNVIQ